MFITFIKVIVGYAQAGYEVNALSIATMILLMAVIAFFLCVIPAWCIVSIGCYFCGVTTSLKMILAIAGLIDVFYEVGAIVNKNAVKID